MEIQLILNQWMNQLVNNLPVGYAFGAGMVSTVNPCGFVMLPVYLSLYMGAEEGKLTESSRIRRFWKAIWVTAVVSAGFALFFGIIGAIVSAGGTLLMDAAPWFSLVIGAALVVMGIWLLLGHHLSVSFTARISSKIGDPRQVSFTGFFLFGIAYAITSLGCTLPIFLMVIGSSIASGDFVAGMIQFISYSLGMGAVLLVLTLGMAFLKEGVVVGKLRSFMPHIQKISGIFIILAGLYTIYFWINKMMVLG